MMGYARKPITPNRQQMSKLIYMMLSIFSREIAREIGKGVTKEVAKRYQNNENSKGGRNYENNRHNFNARKRSK